MAAPQKGTSQSTSQSCSQRAWGAQDLELELSRPAVSQGPATQARARGSWFKRLWETEREGDLGGQSVRWAREPRMCVRACAVAGLL